MSDTFDDFDEGSLYGRKPAPAGNPLARYFRTPGLHVKLPTGGAFLPKGALALTAAGDVPVLPMRSADELLLKSPDALMSGYALEKLLESCVPALRTPKLLSTPDLDVLLLAIRAATHGETMALSARCPECGTQSEFDCHLPTLLGTMTFVEPENPVRLSDDVVAYVRPHTLANATTVALASFEETRRLQAIDAEKPDTATRTLEMNRTMERMTALTHAVLATCIVKVVVPGAEVSDPAQIAEFFADIPKPWTDKLDARIAEVNARGIDKSIRVKCSNKDCGHEWRTTVEFDPASFFDAGSSE